MDGRDCFLPGRNHKCKWKPAKYRNFIGYTRGDIPGVIFDKKENRCMDCLIPGGHCPGNCQIVNNQNFIGFYDYEEGNEIVIDMIFWDEGLFDLDFIGEGAFYNPKAFPFEILIGIKRKVSKINYKPRKNQNYHHTFKVPLQTGVYKSEVPGFEVYIRCAPRGFFESEKKITNYHPAEFSETLENYELATYQKPKSPARSPRKTPQNTKIVKWVR
jgi:hypothetical protein